MTAERNVIAAFLVIALGLVLLLHFALFWVYGGVYIYESSKVVLLLETAMAVVILAFGVRLLLHSVRES